jgi:hypothetical protein
MKMTKIMMRRSEDEEINPAKIRALKALVKKGEGINLEFKHKASFPDKIVCEMIAFANTNGGTLLIGVSDDGGIPGVKFPEEEMFALQKALSKTCRPALNLKVHIIAVAAKKFVIQYDIRQSRRKPHAYVNANGSKEIYVRSNDQTLQATTEMKQIIKRYGSGKNIRFRYGENEDLLMKYLARHPFINFDDYRSLTRLNRYKASRSLVTLVLANVLHITPTEKGDRYSLHDSFGK